MNQFFKNISAATIGVFLAFIILFFFFLVFVSSLSATKPIISENTVLKLDLSGQIPELSGNVEVSAFDLESVDALGMNTIVQLIEHASTDDKIKGLLIQNNSVGGGQATLASIRAALEKFKNSGKFIYAYADYYNQSAYYLSSIADSVFLNPVGMIDLKGFAAFIPFYKSSLDKVGVHMNVFYAGNFKSATEPYRRNEMSDENRMQTKEFLDSMAHHLKVAIAKSRNFSMSEVDDILVNYKGGSAKSSLESGLVDGLVYWDEVEDKLKNAMGVKTSRKLRLKNLSEYNAAVNLRYGKSTAPEKIAVVIAEGTLNYDTKEKGTISEEKYLEIFQKLQRDDKVKAVVLRVNSPGGNSITSEIVWRGVEELKASGKPVVASFGDYAASGGYYIAAGADTIVAAPNSLTGSIGVFMMFPNATELMNEKLGITFDEVKTHPMAVGLSSFKDLSDNEKAYLQKTTDEVYHTFLDRVATGRNMSIEAVHEVAQGRVWTGVKAKELGLVDVIGGLEDAIAIAAEMANIKEYKIKTYPTIKETFIDQLMKGIASSENATVSLGLDKKELKLLTEYQELKNLLLDKTPQARLPFIINFN